MDFVQGDTPKIVVKLTRETSLGTEVIDLTQFSITNVRILKSAPLTLKADGVFFEIEDAVNGIISVKVPPGAFDEPGEYLIEVRLENGGGQSFRIRTGPYYVWPDVQ